MIDTIWRMRNLPALAVVSALFVGLLAGCKDEPIGPGPQAEVLIPPTTKIMDPETRTALTSMAPDGTLRFTRSTPVLQALLPGDVLVSERTPAAPYGFLRKVKVVRQEGTELVVETEGAKLVEAIHRGRFSLRRELRPEDVRFSAALQSGIVIEGLTYPIDTDLGTGGKVRVTGR